MMILECIFGFGGGVGGLVPKGRREGRCADGGGLVGRNVLVARREMPRLERRGSRWEKRENRVVDWGFFRGYGFLTKMVGK